MTVTLTETALETDTFAKYKREIFPGIVSFAAGFPSYPREFSRDVITAGILATRAELIESGLLIGALYQANKSEPQTGAEKGKIAHEIPGVTLKGRKGQTDYNACDTTPLFLIAAECQRYIHKSDISNIEPALKDAIDHISSHIKDDLYIERPPEGADGFTLRVTMWKDSVLPQPGKEEPKYPVIYPQVHFIAARAFLSAAKLLGETKYEQLADRMFKKGIREFIRPEGYVVYRDSEEELIQPSSDELHSLAYIPKKYIDLLPLDAIKKRAEILETPFGYMCTPRDISKQLEDKYHGSTIWTQDNGMIHYGSSKFGLSYEADVAASIAPHIDKGQELFDIGWDDEGNEIPIIKQGNPVQLWSEATREYFAGHSSLLNDHWL